MEVQQPAVRHRALAVGVSGPAGTPGSLWQ